VSRVTSDIDQKGDIAMSKTLGISDLHDYLLTGVMSKAFSVSPFQDSPDSKNLTLELVFENVPLFEPVWDALYKAVVKVQNGKQGRKNYENLKEGQVIRIDYKRPNIAQVDGMTALRTETAGMSDDEIRAHLKALEAKLLKKSN
jgi:hypothetical protein